LDGLTCKKTVCRIRQTGPVSNLGSP